MTKIILYITIMIVIYIFKKAIKALYEVWKHKRIKDYVSRTKQVRNAVQSLAKVRVAIGKTENLEDFIMDKDTILAKVDICSEKLWKLWTPYQSICGEDIRQVIETFAKYSKEGRLCILRHQPKKYQRLHKETFQAFTSRSLDGALERLRKS